MQKYPNLKLLTFSKHGSGRDRVVALGRLRVWFKCEKILTLGLITYVCILLVDPRAVNSMKH